MIEILRSAAVAWLTALLVGVSGFAAYAALFTEPTARTPWLGWAVFRFGQALLVVVILLAAGLVIGSGVAAGRVILGR